MRLDYSGDKAVIRVSPFLPMRRPLCSVSAPERQMWSADIFAATFGCPEHSQTRESR